MSQNDKDMKPFRFLNPPILFTHDGHEVFAGELFFSVSKEDRVSLLGTGNIIPKYSVATRYIVPSDKAKFKPDDEYLWYFKYKTNADWYVNQWKKEEIVEVNITLDPW